MGQTKQMIQYRSKEYKVNPDDWHQIRSSVWSRVNFRHFNIKLDDKIYTSETPEFQEHMVKIKMWEKLND